MATAATLPPPPGAGADDQSASPTTPAAVSPAPPQPSPGMQQGTQQAIAVVSNLRSIAKAFPQTAPFISQINDLMRKVLASMMQHQQTGEPAAPPMGG